MVSETERHLTSRVTSAPLNADPFPHILVRDAFPGAYYSAMLENLPDPALMRPIGEARHVTGYDERYILGLNDEDLSGLPTRSRDFWRDLASWFVGEKSFTQSVIARFHPQLSARFKGRGTLVFRDEALLVMDTTNYNLGPHSDSPRKVITMIFYLPPDDSRRDLGTSIYVPTEPGFTSVTTTPSPGRAWSRSARCGVQAGPFA